MTPKITLYTKHHCPYCKRAKALLRSKGVTFEDIEITDNPELTAEMVKRSGRHTVPQIFIGDVSMLAAETILPSSTLQADCYPSCTV